MKQRNPEATCETCPYFRRGRALDDPITEYGGHCCFERLPYTSMGFINYPTTGSLGWCGQHPDFFLEEVGDENPS